MCVRVCVCVCVLGMVMVCINLFVKNLLFFINKIKIILKKGMETVKNRCGSVAASCC